MMVVVMMMVLIVMNGNTFVIDTMCFFKTTTINVTLWKFRYLL